MTGLPQPRPTRRRLLRSGWHAASALAAWPILVPLAAPAWRGRQRIEIEFLHINAADVVDGIVDVFNRSQDRVTVKALFVQGSYEGLLERLQALSAARQLPALTQGGFTYHKFYLRHLPITPVTRFMEAEGYDTSDFFPAMLRLGVDEQGTVWALPFGVSNPVIYVNLDHYREAGLAPDRDAPRTWEDVRRLARAFTTGDRKGIFYHFDITGNWLYQAMVECAGGRMSTADDSRVTFNEEPGVRALAFWHALVNEDQTMPLLSAQQFEPSFRAGALSMFVTSVGQIPSFTRDGVPFRAYTFPTDGDRPRRVPGGGNALYITGQTAEQRQAAWELVKFLVSPEGTTLIARRIGYMVVRRSPLDRPDLMGDYLREIPNARASYEQVDETVPWYNFPGRGGSRIYKVVQDAILAALNREKTPRQALDDAAEEANRLLRT